MKKLLLTLFIAFFSLPILAQQITEENYLKVDRELWENLEREQNKLYKQGKEYPEKRDSLRKVAQQLLDAASQKNYNLAIEYASVPSGLQRLFWVRLIFSKDTLSYVLKNLPKQMQMSPYGKSLQQHIKTKQVEVGSKYHNFTATTADGKQLQMSSLKGKNILLIYGGLSCMGSEGRDYLDLLHQTVSRNDLMIVAYCVSQNMESLQQEKTKYGAQYILISDFLLDHSPIKIIYGAQTRPTCYFINRNGKVVMREDGLNSSSVNPLIK